MQFKYAWITWNEMCWVKELFWDDFEVVFQYHPPKKDHVNNHKYCLHLWKGPGTLILPPKIGV